MRKHVPEVPSGVSPIGPYSIAVQAGDFLFISGQTAIDPETDTPIQGDVRAQAGRVMENIGLILGDLDLGFDDIVKTTIFLADIADFAVVNEVYAGYFDEAPPARSTIQAAGLPGGYLVEIEVIAIRPEEVL
jgi:2-iminobutanoate/2-iminopropanoate deaminase